MGILTRRPANHHLFARTRALAGFGLLALTLCAQSLDTSFRNPPGSARPKTFWHWMNGNVTRDGITRDLEAMSRIGIGGVTIFDGSTYLPAGPAGYMSPLGRDLMTHAIKEGERLGIEIGMHNAPGWSSSGGPWITPDRAMQQLVWTETTVSGPGPKEIALPQPQTNRDYYRDAFVLAFPAAPGEDLPRTITRAPNSVQIAFTEPFEARAVTIYPKIAGRFPNVALEFSQDGTAYQRVVAISNPGRHGVQPPGVGNFRAVRARFFRITGAGAGDLAEVFLHHASDVEDWNFKANFAYRVGRQMEIPAPGDRADAIDPGAVRDLTSQTNNGRVKWDVPPGAWTILRIGYTPTGQLNVSASEAGRGLECDKMNREATEFHFQNVIAKVLADAGPLAGKSFGTVTIDSYEAGLGNWTARFPEEFRKRAGYEIWRYLPAMTGRVIGDRAISERFLFDVRRAMADLMAGDYYGRMGELCRQHGLKFYVEGYGQGVFDEMQVSGVPDFPMTEFWERTPWTPNRTVKMVSSAAHVYGKPVVAAESFTGEEQTARWLEYPYSLKILGDLMFSLGMNQMVFHRYAQQPHPSAVPGMTMGPYGFHMDRTNTWFEWSQPWIDYLSRSQYLLRQGTYVADILYFTGERPPGAENFLIPLAPEGFNYDLINADALLTRATVQNRRIALLDSGSYSVLVLPPDLKCATPELMRKLREMAGQGATIVGPKPTCSPTLRGYPESDAEVRRIADELWANGRIGGTLNLSDEPDFEYTGRRPDTALSWLHRRLPDAEVYFIGNRQRRTEDVVCTFRVSRRTPEFWNAESGEIRKAASYGLAGNRMRVPIHLEPAESVFVVFREPASAPPVPFREEPQPVAPPRIENTFTVSVWAKPDTDLRMMPRESITGRIDETGKFYLFPAGEGDVLFGKGHAAAGLAVGRNGVFVVERSGTASPAVLVVNTPIEGWTHFALTYRSGKPSLYINGKFVREGLSSGSIVHPGAGNPRPTPETVYHFTALDSLYQSSGQPSPPSNGVAYYFEGNMTDPEVFDHALADNEVSEIFARKLPPPALGVPSVTVEGPWQVAFQENRGAPASLSLPELTSLHKNSDPGVKYFSGTATYSRSLDVPAAMTAGGKRVYLDLGRVEVIAQVRINGRDLGTLWKEPYRVDITEAVHAGANDLQIAVTNLWPNRLIGDEQLPPENEYAQGPGHGITRLPDWYRDGQPKPPGGRVTFATWQFYRKGDPLLESGLLGPVRLLNPAVDVR